MLEIKISVIAPKLWSKFLFNIRSSPILKCSLKLTFIAFPAEKKSMPSLLILSPSILVLLFFCFLVQVENKRSGRAQGSEECYTKTIFIFIIVFFRYQLQLPRGGEV